MVKINRKDRNVAIVVLTATAYFAIFYDVFRDWLKPSITNHMLLFAVSGIVGLGIGISVLLVLSERRKNTNEPNISQDNINDKNHKPDLKKVCEEKGSKKLLVIDVLIIIGILTSIGFAVYSIVIKSDIGVNATVTDISVKNETIASTSLNFTSKEVFSVDNPITVSAVVILDSNFVNNHPEILHNSTAYVYLPTSYPKDATYEYGHELSLPIEVFKGNDGIFRSNPNEIKYNSEGDKCMIFSFVELKVTRTCLPNAQPVIHISSIDSLYQVQSNHTNTALGWLVLAFSIAIVRDFIKDFIKNALSLKK